MSVAYLNGQYMPLSEARISPMDRGFLFGDGVYEVIPSYGGQLVATGYHLERLKQSLEGIQLTCGHTDEALTALLERLLSENDPGNFGVFLQITRGVSEKRQHAFPTECQPTIFAFVFPIEQPSDGSPATANCYSAVTQRDQRWGRCHIKSTALLGNVLHMMEAVDQGAKEVLLFNERDELTEAAACNVFVVSNDVVMTPELDHQKLPGVTRRQCLEFLEKYADTPVFVGPISKATVLGADEVWLSSSTKELAPITHIDGRPVADGRPGPVWSLAQTLFNQHRFDSP